MSRMIQQQSGFSLIEVMISMALATIALLGLASAEMRAIQYSTSSFQYTLGLIEANNAVDQMWLDLCDLQKGTQAFDTTYKSSLQPASGRFTLEFPTNFSNDFSLSVTWVDDRIDDGLENKAQLNVTFPTLPGSCT